MRPPAPSTVSPTSCSNWTIRGPQRDAMSSSSSTTPSCVTACQAAPPGTVRDACGILPTALRVRQQDEIGVGGHDVLGRELRIARARALGLIGDVRQAELAEEIADERIGGQRVVGVVELVVVGHARAGVTDIGHHRRHLRLQVVDLRLRLGRVPGHLARLQQLGIHVIDRGGGGLHQRRDVELVERLLEIARIVGVDHEVRLIRGDGLHVGLVGGDVGRRRLGRVVGVAVHGGHLIAGADGEQHLGGGGRQRHDLGRHRLEGEGSIRCVDRHRERGRRARWGRRGRGAGRGRTSRGSQGEGEQQQAAEGTDPVHG